MSDDKAPWYANGTGLVITAGLWLISVAVVGFRSGLREVIAFPWVLVTFGSIYVVIAFRLYWWPPSWLRKGKS